MLVTSDFTLTKAPAFIAFEGINGCGKTTLHKLLSAQLAASGRSVCDTREPGGTPLAEKLRSLVLQDAMDPLTEALLMFAARRDHLERVILPALAKGEVVLCDRFTDATFAYQGGGRGFDEGVLGQLERMVQTSPSQPALVQPALTVWFDLSPEEAAKRLAGARVPDKFESQPLAFFQRVAQGYARRLKAEPARFARINAAQTQPAVWQAVLAVVVAKGWLA
jgi:dTMP kinase